jgi:hypothetical protein
VHCKCSVSMNFIGLIKTWCTHIDPDVYKRFDYSVNGKLGKRFFLDV